MAATVILSEEERELIDASPIVVTAFSAAVEVGAMIEALTAMLPLVMVRKMSPGTMFTRTLARLTLNACCADASNASMVVSSTNDTEMTDLVTLPGESGGDHGACR